MAQSILAVFPVETLLHIFSLLTVPELSRLLCVSKRFHATVLQALVEHFTRRRLPKWNLAMDMHLVSKDLWSPLSRSQFPPEFTGGNFVPIINDYFLRGYSDQRVEEDEEEGYSTMRHLQYSDMPLPTKSFGFILDDIAPDDVKERLKGYPAIPKGAFELYGLRFKLWFEACRTEDDRDRYDVVEIEHYPSWKWKQQVLQQTCPVQLCLENLLRPCNASGFKVGSGNMRFRLEAEFWRKGDLIHYRFYNTCLEWRISSPLRY